MNSSEFELQLADSLELKRSMISASSVGISAYSISGQCVLANDAMGRIIGAAREQVLAQNFRAIDSWMSSGLLQMADDIIRDGVEQRGDFHLTSSFGREVWLECTMTPFENRGEKYLFLVANDISGRKAKEQALTTLALAIEQSPNLIMITDSSGTIEYVNGRVEEITGYRPHEVIGNNPKMFKSGVESSALYEDLWKTITGGASWSGEICNRKKTGDLYWEYLSISPLFDARGQISHYVANKEDISTRKRLQEELYQQATIDFLTNIYNRRMLLELGGKEVSRARRHSRPLSLLLIDIDHFKRINDAYGHAIGDDILRLVVALCCGLLRISDVMGRLGGDEFVIILPETAAEGAVIVAERIRLCIEERGMLGTDTKISCTVSCTVSVGVAELDNAVAGIDELIKKADAALYSAKGAGRNRVQLSEQDCRNMSVMPD